LTPAYDGCTCPCHTRPGTLHIRPCCGPGAFFASGGHVNSLVDHEDTIAAQLTPAREIARLSLEPENVRSFTLTMDNTLAHRELPAITTGTIEVHGEVVVHFRGEALLRFMARGQRAMMNRALRMARPHMGRRKFRRVRAQVRLAMARKGL
jgi:hypothetical protein